MPVKLAEVGTGILPVTRRTPVPVNVGAATVPAGLNEPVEVSLDPLNVG